MIVNFLIVINQNIHACTAVNDQTTNATGQHFFNGTLTGLTPKEVSSYYSLSKTSPTSIKPDYMPEDSCPYYPETDNNGAENRFNTYFNNTTNTINALSIYSYQWTKYNCTPSLTIFDIPFFDISGSYNAYLNIKTMGSCTIKSGETVNLNAGDLIELNSNFSVEPGAIFTAALSSQPCPNTMNRSSNKLINEDTINYHIEILNYSNEQISKNNALNSEKSLTEVEFQNPFSTFLNLKIKGYDNQPITCIVYNSLMERIIHLDRNISEEDSYLNLDFSNFSNGIYFVNLRFADSISKSYKVIKQTID